MNAFTRDVRIVTDDLQDLRPGELYPMSNGGQVFAVASDEVLVGLILQARDRLVVIAPAVSKAVADALCHRFEELGQLDITVVLDSDPEVYRLGFGEVAALETIRAASVRHFFDLREQAGVRIGVVVSDKTTMIYSPVSMNIEAGSTSAEKPNAILLSGQAADRLASAAGSDHKEGSPAPEIGTAAIDPGKVQQMQKDLKANPPAPFDIARKMNVFTSKVQYVEFSASSYRLVARQIALPAELLNVSDENLRDSIRARLRVSPDDMGRIEITIKTGEESETLSVDDDWLDEERKRIADEYTFPIKNYGRVILRSDRDQFDGATSRFAAIVKEYQSALRKALEQRQAEFEKRIIDEFSTRWKASPPAYFARWKIPATPEKIASELQILGRELFTKALNFDPPTVKVLYKNVSLENIRDDNFLGPLKTIMQTRHVPQEIIETLFESGGAAPESGTFLDR